MTLNKLHPGAIWQFRIRSYLLLGFLGIFLGLWILIPFSSLLFNNFENPLNLVKTMIFFSILSYIFLTIIISEIYARMSYQRWFYELTKEGLRLERGIIWKRYSNIPYERIQNIDIYRGIIARMLGFSTVMIQTAGYSAQAISEGYIPALDVHSAEKVRALIIQKITRK